MSSLSPEQHERMRDELGAYALDALRPQERQAVEQHLDDCESCRSYLHWLAPALDALPASVDQHEPPPRLRANLMATVRAESEAARAETTPRPRRRWSLPSLPSLALRPAAGLAAFVLFAAGLAGGYLLSGGEQEGAFIPAEVPAPLVRDVSATLEHRGDTAILHVHELPPLDRDEVYETWISRDGEVEPGSLFVLRRNGTAEAAIAGPLDNADAVLVTREPRGGSRRPTSPPLLEAKLN